MELFVELNNLDTYDWCFYASLFLAFVSVLGSMVLSYFSAKYWKLDRSRAVLKNVGNMCSNLDRNLCNSVGDIDLTNDFYRVEFGIPAQPFDAITLRAVIKGEDWKDGMTSNVQAQIFLRMTSNVQAQIFLRDGSFVVNGAKGKVSIYSCQNQYDGILYYDEQINRNINRDSGLNDNDLIYIKDKDDKKIAAFVFLKDVKDIYDGRINAVRNIVVRNQKI